MTWPKIKMKTEYMQYSKIAKSNKRLCTIIFGIDNDNRSIVWILLKYCLFALIFFFLLLPFLGWWRRWWWRCYCCCWLCFSSKDSKAFWLLCICLLFVSLQFNLTRFAYVSLHFSPCMPFLFCVAIIMARNHNDNRKDGAKKECLFDRIIFIK